MGAGKTTLGQPLAQQLGYQFFDSDTVIMQATGKTISAIFASDGEPAFRDLETQVLAELSAYQRLVIATGGGIVLRRQNWSYLRHGIVVWLDVPIDQLYQRLQGDMSRPLLQEADPMQRLTAILEARQHLYEQADIRLVVQPEETTAQLLDRLLEEIPKVMKPEIQPPVMEHGQAE